MYKILVCIIICLAFTSAVLAEDESPFNIDLYYGWGGYYRPMEWTPVEITVYNSLKNAFNGELTLSSQQDGLNTLNIMVPEFDLTPELTIYQPLVTKIAYTSQGCNLKLDQVIGKRRKTVWSQPYESKLTPGKFPVLNEYDILIGIVGAGKFGLLSLGKQSVSYFKAASGSVQVETKQAAMVPWDWTGFVSLDLLVLYDPDWIQLQESQLKAIAEWVSNGGRLLLVLGSNPPMGNNPVINLIPFDFMDAKQVDISREQLYKWNLTGSDSETVTLKPLVPKSGAKFYEGVYQDNQCLFAVGNSGFGRIGVLGFDPYDFSALQGANQSRFWVNIIQAVLKAEVSVENTIIAQRRIEFVQDSSAAPVGTNVPVTGGSRPLVRSRSGYPGYYEIGSAYSLNNKVMEFLYSEIKPLSVWFVILLLGALAILLGPFDYKFLKHIDRLPLTWLTCSFWIILFTVGAYYGVQYIRGGKMQLKVVSVLDGIQDEDAAWATHYSGLFASRSDSYELDGLQPNQWWSGIAPTQDTLSAFSNEIGSRRIYCVQEDGGNLPESLPVNIWDIQCMLTESPLEKLPFSAEVRQNGDDVIITIKNESDAAIMGGYVLMDKNHGIYLSSVPAHGTQEFRQRNQPLPYWDNLIRQYSQAANNFRNEAAFFAQGTLQRTQAINNYLSKGASLVCVTYDKAPISFGVKDHTFSYEHVQLARLVVFPNSEGIEND
ncbi:MAG: hypothetical protein JW787_12660 [Sedimentisphaerales bacterium]|nr:hypothetical protein [Sedimentisphaerales bacterium]